VLGQDILLVQIHVTTSVRSLQSEQVDGHIVVREAGNAADNVVDCHRMCPVAHFVVDMHKLDQTTDHVLM